MCDIIIVIIQVFPCRQWLKSSVVLLISMGIPWIVGIVIFSEHLLFLVYIYTICIGLQVNTEKIMLCLIYFLRFRAS